MAGAITGYFFRQLVQAGSGPHKPPYPVGTGSCDWGLKLTIQHPSNAEVKKA
jgi:hypothetical protein